MTAGQAGQLTVIFTIWGFGIYQFSRSFWALIQTTLFRMRLRRKLREAVVDWPKGYREWKARQAA